MGLLTHSVSHVTRCRTTCLAPRVSPSTGSAARCTGWTTRTTACASPSSTERRASRCSRPTCPTRGPSCPIRCKGESAKPWQRTRRTLDQLMNRRQLFQKQWTSNYRLKHSICTCVAQNVFLTLWTRNFSAHVYQEFMCSPHPTPPPCCHGLNIVCVSDSNPFHSQ